MGFGFGSNELREKERRMERAEERIQAVEQQRRKQGAFRRWVRAAERCCVMNWLSRLWKGLTFAG
jgi:hypothetical protein